MASRCMMAAIGALAAGLVLCSCATIISGTHQHITFDSTPPGATVHVDGYPDITTPSSMELARKTSYVATIRKDGYRESTVILSCGFNPVALGNVLFVPVGLLGVVLDAKDGAMGKLNPAAVNVTLQDAGSN